MTISYPKTDSTLLEIAIKTSFQHSMHGCGMPYAATMEWSRAKITFGHQLGLDFGTDKQSESTNVSTSDPLFKGVCLFEWTGPPWKGQLQSNRGEARSTGIQRDQVFIVKT